MWPKLPRWGSNVAVSPAFHLISQRLVTGTNEDIAYIHVKRRTILLRLPFVKSLTICDITVSHPPGPWSLGSVAYALPYMKLICPFVKSPLEQRFLEVRDSVSSVLAIVFVSVMYCSYSSPVGLRPLATRTCVRVCECVYVPSVLSECDSFSNVFRCS